jgi:hypothetical protein
VLTFSRPCLRSRTCFLEPPDWTSTSTLSPQSGAVHGRRPPRLAAELDQPQPIWRPIRPLRWATSPRFSLASGPADAPSTAKTSTACDHVLIWETLPHASFTARRGLSRGSLANGHRLPPPRRWAATRPPTPWPRPLSWPGDVDPALWKSNATVIAEVRPGELRARRLYELAVEPAFDRRDFPSCLSGPTLGLLEFQSMKQRNSSLLSHPPLLLAPIYRVKLRKCLR